MLIEVLKMKNELASPIMGPILIKRFNTYNLSNFQEFVTKRKRIVWFYTNTTQTSARTLKLFYTESIKNEKFSQTKILDTV